MLRIVFFTKEEKTFPPAMGDTQQLACNGVSVFKTIGANEPEQFDKSRLESNGRNKTVKGREAREVKGREARDLKMHVATISVRQR